MTTETNNPNLTVGKYDDEMIVGLFNNFLEDGGSPKVTEFKRHIDMLIKSHVKPLCSGRGSSAPGGTSWRDVQKAKFAGRGAKWVKLSIDEISGTLDRLDDENFDTADYRAWIEAAGFAWIRYAGPRVVTGNQMAAFEVRTVGSTYDCPKSLHYILDDEVDETVTSLGGTPFGMKLEEVAKKEVSDEKPSEDPVSDEVMVIDEEPEVEEEVVNEVPTSDDPKEWEAFLEAEGLSAEIDDEDEDDIFGAC